MKKFDLREVTATVIVIAILAAGFYPMFFPEHFRTRHVSDPDLILADSTIVYHWRDPKSKNCFYSNGTSDKLYPEPCR